MMHAERKRCHLGGLQVAALYVILCVVSDLSAQLPQARPNRQAAQCCWHEYDCHSAQAPMDSEAGSSLMLDL